MKGRNFQCAFTQGCDNRTMPRFRSGSFLPPTPQGINVPIEPCADRARHVRTVAYTIEVVRHAEILREIAIREQEVGMHHLDALALDMSVLEARAERRAACRVLREHIQQHGCKL